MGFINRAISIWPSSVSSSSPGNFTEKMPSLDTDILKALSGIFIPGSKRYPSGDTTSPFASIENAPLLIYPILPSGNVNWKYPSPSIVKSSSL